jgi:hypothetical protein
MRGVLDAACFAKEEIASSGTGSERAQGRERSGEEAPREPVRGGGLDGQWICETLR